MYYQLENGRRHNERSLRSRGLIGQHILIGGRRVGRWPENGRRIGPKNIGFLEYYHFRLTQG